MCIPGLSGPIHLDNLDAIYPGINTAKVHNGPKELTKGRSTNNMEPIQWHNGQPVAVRMRQFGDFGHDGRSRRVYGAPGAG